MYSLFIFSTFDTYPLIQLGVYTDHPILLLYYFIFAIFGGIVMLSVLTGVFYTNFKEFYSQNVESLLKDPEHRGLIKKCLQDKILNFEKIKKILNEFLSSKRKTIE